MAAVLLTDSLTGRPSLCLNTVALVGNSTSASLAADITDDVTCIGDDDGSGAFSSGIICGSSSMPAST